MILEWILGPSDDGLRNELASIKTERDELKKELAAERKEGMRTSARFLLFMASLKDSGVDHKAIATALSDIGVKPLELNR